MAIEVYWSCSSFAAKDGGMKLQKIFPVFSSLDMLSSESRQKLNTNSSLCHIIFRIVSVSCQECYVWARVLI